MYTSEEIDYELDDTCLIVPEHARTPLVKALSYLPEEIIDFVVENCVFVSLDKETRGMYMTINDFRLESKTGFIFFPAELWSKDEEAIAFVVAHEVAHAYKGHGFKSFEDTEATINGSREKDADKQAIEWLKPHFKGSFEKYIYKDWQLS